ncbi:MAG: aspartate/glutamate racemase family protein [Pseudomonadota bacterium]
MHLVLINPNTTRAFTADMVALAAQAAPDDVRVSGLTAKSGSPLITTHAEYDAAIAAVLALAGDLGAADAVIVSAFGDPGRDDLAQKVSVPVVGLAEAAFEIASCCRQGRFAVITTMGDLVDRTEALVRRHGHGERLASVRVTEGAPAALIADRSALIDAMAEIGAAAVREDGAEAIIIGGGPLASTAAALAKRLGVPVISPVEAAVSVAVQRARAARA